MSEWDAIEAAARRPRQIVDDQAAAVERGDAVEAADGDARVPPAASLVHRNGALRVLIEGLIDASRKGAYAVYSLPETAARSLDQHRPIVDALAASDVERAAELARDTCSTRRDSTRRPTAGPRRRP